MNRKQLIQIVTYSLTYNIFQLVYLWSAQELLTILSRNFRITIQRDRDYYLFTISSVYYLGILLSGFLWPRIVKNMTLFWGVLLSYSLMIILYGIQIFTRNIAVFILINFLIGFFQNSFSVGNSFLFEFSAKENYQKSFTLMQMVGLVLGKFYPTIGSYVYHRFNYQLSFCFLIVVIFLSLFLTLFYFVFKDFDNKKQQEKDSNKELEQEINKGIVQVFKKLFTNKSSLVLFLFFCMSFGMIRSYINIMMIYTSRPFDIGGMGKSSHFRNMIGLLSLPLTVGLLDLTRRVTYTSQQKKRFIQIVLLMQMCLYPLLPFVHRFVNQKEKDFENHFFDLFGFIYALTYTFNISLYTPIVKVRLNTSFEQSERTSLNSMLSTLMNLSVILFNQINFRIYEYFYDDLIEPETILHKYFPFVFQSMIILCFFLMLLPISF